MKIHRRVLLLNAVGTAVTMAATPRAASAAESYEYDVHGRLTKVTYNNGSTVHFTYDGAGNRTWKVFAPPGVSFSAVLDNTYVSGEEDLPGQQAFGTQVQASPLAGVPEYTFLWQRISGSTLIQPTALNSPVTEWKLTGSPHTLALYSAVWRCRVVDKVSATAYSPNLTVDLTRSY